MSSSRLGLGGIDPKSPGQQKPSWVNSSMQWPDLPIRKRSGFWDGYNASPEAEVFFQDVGKNAFIGSGGDDGAEADLHNGGDTGTTAYHSSHGRIGI
jgi:hypothetical protein